MARMILFCLALVNVSPVFGQAYPVVIQRVLSSKQTGPDVFWLTVQLDSAVPSQPYSVEASIGGKHFLQTAAQFVSPSNYLYYVIEQDRIRLALNLRSEHADITSVRQFESKLPLRAWVNGPTLSFEHNEILEVLSDEPGRNNIRIITARLKHARPNVGRVIRAALNGVRVYLNGRSFVEPKGEYSLQSNVVRFELFLADPALQQAKVSSGEELKTYLPLAVDIEE